MFVRIRISFDIVDSYATREHNQLTRTALDAKRINRYDRCDFDILYTRYIRPLSLLQQQ